MRAPPRVTAPPRATAACAEKQGRWQPLVGSWVLCRGCHPPPRPRGLAVSQGPKSSAERLQCLCQLTFNEVYIFIVRNSEATNRSGTSGDVPRVAAVCGAAHSPSLQSIVNARARGGGGVCSREKEGRSAAQAGERGFFFRGGELPAVTMGQPRLHGGAMTQWASWLPAVHNPDLDGAVVRCPRHWPPRLPPDPAPSFTSGPLSRVEGLRGCTQSLAEWCGKNARKKKPSPAKKNFEKVQLYRYGSRRAPRSSHT